MSNARIGVDIVLLALLLFAPWWLLTAGACVAAFFFEQYRELFLLGFLYDLLYAVPVENLFGLSAAWTLGSIIAYAILKLIKKYTRLHV